MKHLVPDFKRNEAPGLARKLPGPFEIGKNRVGVHERARARRARPKQVLYEIA